MNLLCNAFNDPSNPWYYVVGVISLILVFGALAAYIILSKKLEKKKNDGASVSENPANDELSHVDPVENTAEQPETVDGTVAADEQNDTTSD